MQGYQVKRLRDINIKHMLLFENKLLAHKIYMKTVCKNTDETRLARS